MKISFQSFLFLSLVIHSVLISGLLYLKKDSPKKEIITVEYKFEKKSPAVDDLPKSVRPKISSKKGTKSNSQRIVLNSSLRDRSILDKFKPNLNFDTTRTTRENDRGLLDGNGDTFNISPNKDNHNASWGSGSASFGRIQDYLLYKKIYDYVDGALFFPSFFVRRNIQGVTNARLVLDSDGDCDWEKTKIYGHDAFMQIYVLSVLKTACKQTFKPFIKNRIVTNVDLSFQFAITEASSKEQADENKFIVGNTLMFYRNSYKSIMQWEFGPFQGIFPVPAVYLNLPWIQENWDKIMNHKDPISEFKKEFGS